MATRSRANWFFSDQFALDAQLGQLIQFPLGDHVVFRYKLDSIISRGKFSVVYRAMDM